MSAFLLHGGRLDEACARYGGAPADWLDLSTGINPLPWPVKRSKGTDWRRLPDPEQLSTLEALAASHFGIASENCCAVPGSELGLRLLAGMLGLPGCPVPPCYNGHIAAFAETRAVTLPKELPTTPCIAIFANPNNPDGRVRDPGEVESWLAAATARDGWLVVDEAFADPTPQVSMACRVGEHERLIVLRSFGKFFGLAGARLGFVLGPRPVLARLRAVLGDWPVNAGALELGLAAYADTQWIADTRADLPRRVSALDAVLARHGLSPMGACPLFRLIETDMAPALFENLARRHILTRPFATQREWLRFGVPAEYADLARLDAALLEAMHHG